MKKTAKIFALILALTVLMLSACSAIDEHPQQSDSVPQQTESTSIQTPSTPPVVEVPSSTPGVLPEVKPSESPDPSVDQTPTETDPPVATTPAAVTFSLSDVPEYSGKAFVVLNDHQPYFTSEEITDISFESYSPLDELGRCGPAFACVGIDIMPTEERGSIGMVKPSGWHTVRYNGVVDGNYLYNRCHLIGYQLTGENANTQNLITGTRYLNIEGMLPYENLIAEYVEDTGNHVLYRVTPIFEGDDLLATGVLMEGMSVEDEGADVCFCVFAYNVQPGIVIDYATGESHLAEGVMTEPEETPVTPPPSSEPETTAPGEELSTEADYILNTNTKKFHYPSCSSVDDMKEKNKKEYVGSRDELIAQGYSPCGRCKP